MRSDIYLIWTAILTYTFIILFGCSDSLNVVKVKLPELADLRLPITLSCTYEIENDEIFSIKWYKEDLEFYRFMPKHKPELMLFPLEGAVVRQDDGDNYCSNKNCTIVLEQLLPSSSRTYTCEVSTEGPAFRTYSDSANMTVAAPPLKEPELEGLKGSYSIGDILDISCRTSPSLPPASIDLFINGNVAGEKMLSRTVMPAETKLFTTTARLKFVLTKDHFVGGILLKVRCLSTFESTPSSAKSITGSSTLGDSQFIHKQKLEWSNSSQKLKSSVFISIPIIITLVHDFGRIYVNV